MKGKHKTKEQLMSELAEMRQRIAELETADIRRKQADEALWESEKRFRSVAETASDAIIIFDNHENIFFWNQAAQVIFGYRAGETRGRLLASIMPKRFGEVFRGKMKRVMSTGQSGLIGRAVEATGIRKDGSEFPLEISLATWRTKGEVFFTIIARDITERKRTEEELAYMATHDALTGLPNRWLFNDRLVLELARADRNRQKLAVMLLDLDQFKEVNDTLGHTVGDKLLQDVGRRLTGLVRKSDTLARMGGDEFMLMSIFPGIRGEGDAVKIAQRILEAFRRPFVLDGHEVCITVSVGIAIYPHDGQDTDTLMRSADIAMYRAKEQGRDNYQHYSRIGNKR